MTPYPDFKLKLWVMFWSLKHGRHPKVSELRETGQIALGKKIFEYLDYRDAHRPELGNETIYEACLGDHGVDRDRPDGLDVSLRRWSYPEIRGLL